MGSLFFDGFYFIVHGSLARAGKVKAATPKVDKQEKKKSPKGRAKKRILYNRRCVPIYESLYYDLIVL
jgi:small subunit ribosomal protein S30e